MGGIRELGIVASVILSLCSVSQGEFMTYTDKSTFLTDTAATDATGPLPSTGYIGPAGGSAPGTATTVGTVSYQAVRYLFTDWSSRFPGNELAISYGADGSGSSDSVNLLTAGPVYSLGFDFVEPQFDPNVNGPFVDSTFEVTVKNGSTSLFSFTFNAPNDTAAFIGVAGAAPFDRVEVREIVGTDDNEFYGRVYTGIVPVPEPSSLAMIGMGLAGMVGYGWRRRLTEGHARDASGKRG